MAHARPPDAPTYPTSRPDLPFRHAQPRTSSYYRIQLSYSCPAAPNAVLFRCDALNRPRPFAPVFLSAISTDHLSVWAFRTKLAGEGTMAKCASRQSFKSSPVRAQILAWLGVLVFVVYCRLLLSLLCLLWRRSSKDMDPPGDDDERRKPVSRYVSDLHWR